MKNHPSLLLLAAAATTILASAQVAEATISVNIQGDLLKDQNSLPAPQNTLFLLVASTQDAVFTVFDEILQGKSTAVGSILGGDDTVIFKGDLTGFGENGVLDKGNLSLDFSNPVFNGAWGQGDRLALLWFPTLTANTTTLPLGARFGFYDGGVALVPNFSDAIFTGVDGSRDWITPANGTSAYSLAFFTKDGVQLSPGVLASNSASAGTSMGTVAVPEPSTAGLLLLGGIGVLARRRRAA